MCVCSLSVKTLCNPFTPAGLKGVLPLEWPDGQALGPDWMTLSRLPGTRAPTGHKISEPLLYLLPLTLACPQIARARGGGTVPGVLGVPVFGTGDWGAGCSSPAHGTPLWVDGS